MGDAQKTNATTAPDAGHEPKIGIVLVHGIGEQRRFEHLDGELRPLIDALVRSSDARIVKPEGATADTLPSTVTVEIVEGTASTLHADQDTWSTEFGAPVRVVVEDGGVRKHIHFHEVWWADVNEPYSLWKQIKFWCWGLSIWLVPSKPDFAREEINEVMALPKFPPDASESEFSLRLRLFFVCNVFAMAGFSLGAIVFFLKRLFGFQAPSIVKILVNYISAVKLYSQSRRSDGGFLDAYTEPPRVSIRRRMIRTLADVALADYDRWYVFAHSLGSVVAFNGLQENAHALPNYLSQKQFNALVAGVNGKGLPLAGPKRPGDYTGATDQMLPARPLWLKKDAVVYRDRFLSKFHGLLTYGSPLDKFAAIWPSRVPINKKDEGLSGHAGKKAEWINVYDPTDPVAAQLDAFERPSSATSKTLLEPTNYPYASHPVLLLSHLHYLDGKTGQTDRLADCLMRWVLGGKAFVPGAVARKSRWLEVGTWRCRRRTLLALVTWVAAYLLLTFLGALSLPLWKSLFSKGGSLVTDSVLPLWADFFQEKITTVPPWLQSIADTIRPMAVWLYEALIAPVIGLVGCVLGKFFEVMVYLVRPLWDFAFWLFPKIFGADSLISKFATAFHLPELIAEMIKLSFGVALFVAVAGILGWLLVFDRKPIEPPSAADVARRAKDWARNLAAKSGKETAPTAQ